MEKGFKSYISENYALKGRIMTEYGENLLKKIEECCAHYNIEKIRTAIEYAENAHKDQKRKSGEPYVIHPIAVAETLLSFDCDTDSIVAALFHDIVEDTDITLEDIKKGFGAQVALLVDGVTKLGRIMYSSREEQQLETLRKMLLAMAKDIRVIPIKLADRLHNVRTLASLPPDRQRAIALESIEVYAPLAHRLGIQSIKTEIEDTSLRYLDAIGVAEIEENLQMLDENNAVFYEIKEKIIDKLKEVGIEAEVSGRVKHLYSIYRKMFIQGKNFNEIYDLYAFRVIVDKVSECYNVLGYVHDLFRAIPGRLKDYIATPKPNMYQSLHTTVSYNGNIFEIQIRTHDMHRTAELGIAAHWKYKSGVFGEDALDSKLSWVRKLLEVQNNVSDADDFMKTFKIDLFSDQVFVSTPKGDIINLPAESNIIDFAYTIHTAIGNKMIGAKVNGRIAELTTRLHNGDVVEIITSQSSNGPSRDWLKVVKTNEAKTKIRQWFKKEKREENIAQGREDLERELRRNNININNVDREALFAPTMKRYAITDIDEFYAAIGYGGIFISKILPKLKDEYSKLQKQNEPPKVQNIENRKRKSINGIIVEDLDNCLVRLAGCCTPLPGDSIIGFVTRGYGVAIHKSDCKNIKNIDKDRLVNVHWDGDIGEYFATEICITAMNRIDLLADITTALAGMRIVMHSINLHEENDGRIQVFLSIDVHDINHLDGIIQKLKRIAGTLDISRRKGDMK